jgi:glyoxylase-like metal-dependent hydrolase (beta-lactamase superfamily II)
MKSPALAVSPPRRFTLAFAPVVTLSNTIAVCVRDSGDVALVDVGWSAETCADPRATLGRARAASLGVVVSEKDAIVSQLRAFGIEPSRVKTILATHLHLDHVGGACDFPNAEVVCTARELAAYHGFPRDLGYRAADLARASRMRVLSLDAGPTYGFAQSADVFGDGEVVLLDARGHTPGHVAVALRTRTECFVHIGDAVYQSWEYALDPAGPCLTARFTSWRKKELTQTYARIRSCEADPRKPMIVPSHDMSVLERLPREPSYVA